MELITACEANSSSDVEAYLDTNPEALNKLYKKHFEECTPLHYAAQYGHLGIVNLLLRVSVILSKDNVIKLFFSSPGS